MRMCSLILATMLSLSCHVNTKIEKGEEEHLREDARSGAGGKARLLMGRQVERNLIKKVMAAPGYLSNQSLSYKIRNNL